MEYRNVQGLLISEIGVGCYPLSGVYGKKDVQEFRRMLLRAYDLGVTYYDTADTYGDAAEEILGETLKPFRNGVTIATKVGIRKSGKPNLSRKYIHNACENSLRRLQTDYIDLYQIHFDDPATPIEETIDTLEELKSLGRIRYYGLGHLPVNKIEAYIELGEIMSVLFELSAVARGARKELLPLCRKSDIGAMAYSVTGRGLLTGYISKDVTFEPGDIRIMDPLFQRERFDSALRISRKISEIGDRYGKTRVQTSIAWVLSQAGISCALTGPSTINHLEENLGGSGWLLSSEDLSSLEDTFKKEDSWLFEKQSSTLKAILSEPIYKDPSQSFIDLIYVIETAILLGLKSETELLPIFMELYSIRNDLKESNISKLRDLQEKLNAQIDI